MMGNIDLMSCWDPKLNRINKYQSFYLTQNIIKLFKAITWFKSTVLLLKRFSVNIALPHALTAARWPQASTYSVHYTDVHARACQPEPYSA